VIAVSEIAANAVRYGSAARLLLRVAGGTAQAAEVAAQIGVPDRGRQDHADRLLSRHVRYATEWQDLPAGRPASGRAAQTPLKPTPDTHPVRVM
jgi:hypothetical protein